MQHTAIYYHVDVVTVYYHWREGVYCRKECDNFHVEAASVEPERKREHYQFILFVLWTQKVHPFLGKLPHQLTLECKHPPHPEKKDLK